MIRELSVCFIYCGVCGRELGSKIICSSAEMFPFYLEDIFNFPRCVCYNQSLLSNTGAEIQRTEEDGDLTALKSHEDDLQGNKHFL